MKEDIMQLTQFRNCDIFIRILRRPQSDIAVLRTVLRNSRYMNELVIYILGPINSLGHEIYKKISDIFFCVVLVR